MRRWQSDVCISFVIIFSVLLGSECPHHVGQNIRQEIVLHVPYHVTASQDSHHLKFCTTCGRLPIRKC